MLNPQQKKTIAALRAGGLLADVLVVEEKCHLSRDGTYSRSLAILGKEQPVLTKALHKEGKK